jgi:hypothetical protein
MQGIKNEPFIDVAKYLPIDELKAMEKDICIGISKSKINAGVYGPGVANEKQYKSVIGLLGKYMRSSDPEDRELIAELNNEQRSLFFKLYEGMYSASTVVYLRDFKEAKSLSTYMKKGSKEATYFTENAKHFPKLLEWIDTLPFDEVGRVIFFLHDHDSQLLLHRDGPGYIPHKNEFLWLNPCEKKKLYIYNEDTEEKNYIVTPAAFFNDLDMHGGDSCSTMTWSLRIDGKFTEKFKKQLGINKLDTY